MGGRVSQVPLEVVIDGQPGARISQIPLEAIIDGQGNARVSQDLIEAILDGNPGVHISQIVIEVIGIFIEVPVPQVYPTLPGLAFPVGWKSKFFNLDTQEAVSGAQIDLGISDTPLHKFTLNYEFLRDNFGFNEQRLMRGFFFAMRGNLVRFNYKHDDDHQVKSQIIGTTDGSSRIYTLVRTYGVGEASGTEPIGYIDLTLPYDVYLDGVKQDKSSYTVDTTVPVRQQIIFAGVPAAGKVITVDMDYFYYCKFEDPEMSLDKFITAISSGQGIVLQSCRPGA
jgi:hypothetical protein